MKRSAELAYRIALAQGFLAEAEQDWALGRWRSCVDNRESAQEALEAARRSVALAERLREAI